MSDATLSSASSLQTIRGSASAIVCMGSLFTMNAIAASAGLQPLLEAAAWEGRIAGVFHTSLICHTAPGRLLHLHAGPQLVSPFSLRLEGDFTAFLQNIRPVPGMPVRQTASIIDIAGHLHLRLQEVTYYQSPRYVTGQIDREALVMARHTLRSYGHTGGCDRLPGIQTLVTATKRALTDGTCGQLLEAARRLVGLGPGLTPSGDDFLVGYLRGLWLLSRDKAGICAILDRLRDALLPTLDTQTTRVGAEFMRYALDGAFAEILDQAAEALVTPTQLQSVQSTMRTLLAQGQTSGTDTTRGLLTSLEALLPIPSHEARSPRRDVLTVSERCPARRM
jgi:Protein of unknown function (DUF2877)